MISSRIDASLSASDHTILYYHSMTEITFMTGSKNILNMRIWSRYDDESDSLVICRYMQRYMTLLRSRVSPQPNDTP